MQKTILTLGALALLAALAPAQNTNFLAWDEEFAEYGDWAVQSFRLSGRRSFRLRTATDYKADVVVIPANQLRAFQDGDDFFGWGFDDAFGNKTVTLNAGNYYLAVRNQVDGGNYVRVELDHLMTPAHAPGWQFGYWGAYDTDYLEPKYRYWSVFAKQSNQRLFVDGANVGLQTYVMPFDQLSRFRTGRSFSYYTLYSRNNTDMPGFYELRLPTGTYALGFYNRWNDYIAFTYEFERWVRSGVGAMSLGGAAPQIQLGTKMASRGTKSYRDNAPTTEVIGSILRQHPGIGGAEALFRTGTTKAQPWVLDSRRPKPEPERSSLMRLVGEAPSLLKGR